MERPHTIEFGIFAKPISEQLSDQGLAFDAETIAHLEKDVAAVSRLKVRGVLSYSVGNKAYDKLAKQVWAAVQPVASEVTA